MDRLPVTKIVRLWQGPPRGCEICGPGLRDCGKPALVERYWPRLGGHLNLLSCLDCYADGRHDDEPTLEQLGRPVPAVHSDPWIDLGGG